MKHDKLTNTDNVEQAEFDNVVKLDKKELAQLKKEVDLENTDTSNVHEVPSVENQGIEYNEFGHRHGQLAITLIASELIKSGNVTDEMSIVQVKSAIAEAFNLLAKDYETHDFVLDKSIDATFESGFIKNDNGWEADLLDISNEHYTGLLAAGAMYTFGHINMLRKIIGAMFVTTKNLFQDHPFNCNQITTWLTRAKNDKTRRSEIFFITLMRFNDMLKDDYRPLRFKQGVLELEENVDYVPDPNLKCDGILG